MGVTNPLPYNTAKITLKVQGTALDVIKLTGVEALSSPFRFEIDALIDRYFDLSGSLKTPSQLTLTGVDGIQRHIAGIITQVEEGEPHKDSQLKCRFILESSLRLLALQSDHRVILGYSLPDIVRETCERHGINKTEFDLTQRYPVRPYVVQVGETDLAFIQRLLGKSGISFWSSVNTDNPNQEIITFTDHNANCPYLARNVLEYKAPDNLVKEYNSGEVHVGLHKLQISSQQQTDNIAIHDWNENTPSTKLYTRASVGAHEKSQGFPATLSTHFGLGSRALDETEQLAKQHAEYARSQAWYCEAHGNVIDMAAGHVFSLDASDFNPEHSGDMIVTTVAHFASQAAGLNLDGNEVAYRHEAHCIKRETAYRPAIPNHPPVPMTFTARIESEGQYATLDAQGRYKLRNLFDLSATRHTQASMPIRKLQAFGGPPNNATVGMHMPLQDGDEVLLSCLNGDPDRPMIVGSVYNADKVSPVTARNKNENMIRSQSGNELLMDDKIDRQVISLHTHDQYNILRFDADLAEQKIILETQHGAMSQFAKKTHSTTAGDSIHERSGNERIELVENKHHTETQNGAIHHQAKTDVIEKAHNNIISKSGENTELRAGNDMVFNVEDNATFTINGSDGFHASVNNGELTINAAKDISINGKGGGDITFEQQGGGFKIDAGGNVKLYGKNVMLGGQGQVNLIGNVSYTIGGGSIPGAASVTAPLVRQEIEAIVDPNDPEIIDLIWSKKRIAVGEKVELSFTVHKLKPGDTATITISELGAQGNLKEIDNISYELNDGAGHHTLPWQRSAEQIDNDMKADLEADGEISLAYVFDVEVTGVESELSPVLSIADTLDIKKVLEGFQYFAKNMSLDSFASWMRQVFEGDDQFIPESAYYILFKKLQQEPKSLLPPCYVIGSQAIQGDLSGQAGYNDKYKFIVVSRELVLDANSDTEKAMSLYLILLEELGHHLDNLLRVEISKPVVTEKSKWDAGAVFAFSQVKNDIQGQHAYNYAYFEQGNKIRQKLIVPENQFDKNRLMQEQKGWIQLPSGEIQKLHLFDSGDIDDKDNKVSDGIGLSRGSHKTIEKILLQAGKNYTKEVLEQIYFGNWLRDISQLNDATPVGVVVTAIQAKNKYLSNPIKNWFNFGSDEIEFTQETQDKLNKQTAIQVIVDLVAVMAYKEFYPAEKFTADSLDVAGHAYTSYKSMSPEKRTVAMEQYWKEVKNHLSINAHSEDNEKHKKHQLFRELDIYRVDLERLGGYSAAEHIDNLYDPTQAYVPVDDSTTLAKKYIEDTKEFIKKELKLAIEYGPTPDGFRHFGSALHPIEDFFSHSNYLEIKSLTMSFGDSDLEAHIQKNVNPYVPKNKNGIYPLVTGNFLKLDTAMTLVVKLVRFLPDEDKTVALDEFDYGQKLLLLLLRRKGGTWENIANQYESILMSKNYLLNLSVKLKKKFDDIMKKVIKYLKSSILDSVTAMALELLIDGLIYIMREEGIAIPKGIDYDSKHPVMENLWNMVEVLIAEYLSKGKSKEKKKILEKIISISSDLREAIRNKKYEDILKNIFLLGKLYQDFMLDPNSTNPSHTQLAKDYSEHPLHPLAIRLAEASVKDIAIDMHQIWFDGIKDSQIKQEKTELLLDKAAAYLSHPALESRDVSLRAWSDDLIKTWWSFNKKAASPKDPQPHEH